MSAIDTYGDFDFPEEKSVIEVVEDPVKTVISSYELFIDIIKKKNLEMNLLDMKNCIRFNQEIRYKLALKMLEGRENMKIKDKDTIKIMEYFKDKKEQYDYDATFISAVQNITNLDLLILNEFTPSGIYNLGYRLKANKILIFGKNAVGHIIGSFIENGLIINKGNFGYIGNCAENGLIINFNKTNDLGLTSLKNVHIIYLVNKDFYYRTSSFMEYLGGHIRKKEVRVLKSRLENRLYELDFLNEIHDIPTEDDYALVRKFDFKSFEKDVKRICKRAGKLMKSNGD